MSRVLDFLMVLIVITLLALMHGAAMGAECGQYYKLKTSLNWIEKGVERANCIIDSEEFSRVILSGSYTHFNGDNKDIIKAFRSESKAIVSSYYKWPSRAIAYRQANSTEIYFNRAKKSYTDICGKVNTLIHEKAHTLNFKHKGNRRHLYQNEKSVPYSVGRIAENICRGKTVAKPIIKAKRSLWSRFKRYIRGVF